MTRIQRPKGTDDLLPEQVPVVDFLFDTCRDVLRRHGYGEIRTPLFEETALFVRSLGEVTDVVEKEMFSVRRGEILGIAGLVGAGRTEVARAIFGADAFDSGRILVEGFYDRVRPLTDADRAQIAAAPFDEEEYKAKLGIPDVFGEAGYTTLERAWGRPTLEVNGIWGGFQGDGVKTVLPSQAHAKITCRLVADQQPEEIAQLLAQHVQRHTPPGVQVTVTIPESGAIPYLMPADHAGNVAAHAVLTELYGKQPFYARSGGTIPVCALFLNSLGVFTVNFAFGLNDERQHSPNEFFRLASFRRGQQAYCMLLEEVAHA